MFIPLAKHYLDVGRRDGSTDFAYSRFLVPHLMRYSGWAIFADGDMLCRGDVAKLWALRDSWGNAVMVVKHDYKTTASKKFLGAQNRDYPRKNWSSLVLWNCGHCASQRLTPEYIRSHDGAHLHQFAWAKDEEIGTLPLEWNWLVGEYPRNDEAKLVHYTLGTPCFKEYKDCDYSEDWMLESDLMLIPIGSLRDGN